MNVLLINGSPHAHGCTDAALQEVAKALNADGLKSDLKLRKAARLIADSAVAVAPKAPEAAEEAPASEE